jgi:hypothetical protein
MADLDDLVAAYRLEPTKMVRTSLRRYASRWCPGRLGYCDALVPMAAGWPDCCQACGEPFGDTDEWMELRDELWETQGGDLTTLRDAEPGSWAMVRGRRYMAGTFF